MLPFIFGVTLLEEECFNDDLDDDSDNDDDWIYDWFGHWDDQEED